MQGKTAFIVDALCFYGFEPPVLFRGYLIKQTESLEAISPIVAEWVEMKGEFNGRPFTGNTIYVRWLSWNALHSQLELLEGMDDIEEFLKLKIRSRLEAIGMIGFEEQMSKDPPRI